MVEIPNEVKKMLKKIAEKFKPEKIYLFGSRAVGKAKKDSDWDFIIVSKKFRTLDGYNRAVRVYKLSKGEFAFDVLCFTPEEFEQKKKEPSLISAAVEQNALIEISKV